MPPKVAQMIREQEKQNLLNKLKNIGYEFDNYCVFVPNKEQWEKEKFQRDIWYLIIYHRFDEITYLEINFSKKSFKKYIERDNYREAMCPEEEYCEKFDMPLIDEEEEIFYQLGWIKETTKQRKEKEKQLEEQYIFKQFEELGYEIYQGKNYIAMENTKQKGITIKINGKYYFKRNDDNFCENITLQEHQLLHKLFKLWGWI